MHTFHQHSQVPECVEAWEKLCDSAMQSVEPLVPGPASCSEIAEEPLNDPMKCLASGPGFELRITC